MSGLKSLHALCAVCGSPEDNVYSLGVEFSELTPQKVGGEFQVQQRHQGYMGLLHGGIASSLLDAAMTHCLLNQGVAALTAQLDVRYHHPIKVNDVVKVTGECVSVKRGVYFLNAELCVEGEARVSAKGKFIRSSLVEQ